MSDIDEGISVDSGQDARGEVDSVSQELDGAFVSEDDGTPDATPEVEGEEPGGEPKEQEPDSRQLAQRLAEKERQAQGITRALSEERRARRVAEDRLYQVIERAMLVQGGGGQPDEQEADSAPDPETDAAGAILHKIGSLEDRIAQQDEQRLAEQQERQVDQLIGNVTHFLQQDTAAFAQEYPDYPEAEQFVGERMLDGIAGRLRFENPGADPQRIAEVAQRIFADDLARIHLEHARGNQSFAGSVYQMAQRLGWQGSGQPARAAPRRAAPPSPELEAHRRRLAGGRSLSQVPGSQPRRPASKKEVVDMSDDDFSKLLESGVDFKKLAESIAGE